MLYVRPDLVVGTLITKIKLDNGTQQISSLCGQMKL